MHSEDHHSNCEATLMFPATRIIESKTPGLPFRLCEEAADRLFAFALRPIEWFRLAAVHGVSDFYLHNDFYDESGKAWQAEIPVAKKPCWAIPPFQEFRTNVDFCVDFAMTRWFLDDNPVLEALSKFPRSLLLESLRKRTTKPCSADILERAYIIAAHVLGTTGADWIREQWASPDKDLLFYLSVATAACLPHAEGLPLVLNAVSQLEARDRGFGALALAHFRSQLVLDWIETVVLPEVSRSWGDLAACSGIDWHRITKWLDIGRPLSLVALDALCACATPRVNQSRLIRKTAPRLQQPPTEVEIRNKLDTYKTVDPVPRVRNTVNVILSRVNEII